MLAFLIGILGFALVVVALFVVADIQQRAMVDESAAADPETMADWKALGSLLGAFAIGCLALRFVLDLRKIVVSVDAGDPFIARNANRLSRMGWMALGIQLLLVVVGEPGVVEQTAVGASSGGFALALTLFVLARVFRHGTALRADLEGTV
ncbi:MAG: DUF2975 domain-containing protein [Planctomycetota bacterium]